MVWDDKLTILPEEDAELTQITSAVENTSAFRYACIIITLIFITSFQHEYASNHFEVTLSRESPLGSGLPLIPFWIIIAEYNIYC